MNAGIIPKGLERVEYEEVDGTHYAHQIGPSVLWGKARMKNERHTQITYWAMDLAEKKEERDADIQAGLKGVCTDGNWFHYAMVRFGQPPHCQYYPLPKLIADVKEGRANNQRRKKLWLVAKAYKVTLDEMGIPRGNSTAA